MKRFFKHAKAWFEVEAFSFLHKFSATHRRVLLLAEENIFLSKKKKKKIPKPKLFCLPVYGRIPFVFGGWKEKTVHTFSRLHSSELPDLLNHYLWNWLFSCQKGGCVEQHRLSFSRGYHLPQLQLSYIFLCLLWGREQNLSCRENRTHWGDQQKSQSPQRLSEHQCFIEKITLFLPHILAEQGFDG